MPAYFALHFYMMMLMMTAATGIKMLAYMMLAPNTILEDTRRTGPTRHRQ